MKILMLIDSLSVGGAETHVQTLAAELKAAGHEVAVASSGGEVADWLAKNGIKHLPLPDVSGKECSPNRDSTPTAVRLTVARELIARYVDELRPDVVHAHTRRCAVLASAICKRRRVPLITTAHARFSMKFPKDQLSEWGDGTIVVSRDILSHLASHSQIDLRSACVIENGVKMPKKENIDRHTPLAEGKGARRIVFMSRLDADCSLGAYILCNAAPHLARKYSDLEIIIIGGGTEYRKISKKTEQINLKINHRLINAVGNVAEPEKYFARGALFVGVSRSALEAMAHGMPVILLGNEGYLGLFDESKLASACSTNFTCRDSQNYPSEKELFDEICRYFDMPSAERERLCDLSLSVIEERYTAREMARRTCAFYRLVACRVKKRRGMPSFPTKKVVLCGYYGRKNFGDEAILSALRKKIRERDKDLKIEVLTDRNLLKSISKMAGADLFVFGGGSLLQNKTSNASLFYYLSLILASSMLCSMRVMLSNGFGPIVTRGALQRDDVLRVIARAIDLFDLISVRDGESRAALSTLLPHRKVHLVPDPALIGVKKINRELINGEKCEKRGRFFIFNPCVSARERIDESVFLSVGDTIGALSQKFEAEPRLLVLNEEQDGELARRLSALLDGCEVISPRNESELIGEIHGALFALCQRYHGALYCASCGIPTVAISHDPKMRALCNELFLNGVSRSEILSKKYELIARIDGAISRDRANSAATEKRIKQYSRLSSRSIDAILEKLL